MKIGSFDTQEKIMVIAEIGNNHEGSYSLAEEMIGQAAKAGADAVKFQTFQTEHYVGPGNPERFKRLKSFELSFDEFKKLSQVAKEEGVIFLSTPFDLESARFLNAFVPAFKIASGDNNFYPLLTTVAQFGKPVLLSTGLADMAQIRFSKALIEQIWHENAQTQEMAVLHCVSSYPVPPEQANLGAIQALKTHLGGTIGYSDHSLGIEAAIMAATLGARIIEKHFTLDHHYSDFRDHQLSATPPELTQMVERLRTVPIWLGQGEKVSQPDEIANTDVMRRSIAACRELKAGSTLQWKDLTWVRPGTGFPPGQEHLLLGRTLHQTIQQGEAITLEMLEE